jgi:hypothetical protein
MYLTIYEALRDEPKKLFNIVKDPSFHLNTHSIDYVEFVSFVRIQKQAFAKRRYRTVPDNRHRTYRKYLNKLERQAMRLEIKYMECSVLSGAALYEEIARVMSIKNRSHITRQQVLSILESASDVIADLEHPNFIKELIQ